MQIGLQTLFYNQLAFLSRIMLRFTNAHIVRIPPLLTLLIFAQNRSEFMSTSSTITLSAHCGEMFAPLINIRDPQPADVRPLFEQASH